MTRKLILLALAALLASAASASAGATCATEVGKEVIAALRKQYSDFEECEFIFESKGRYEVVFYIKDDTHVLQLYSSKQVNPLRGCSRIA
jgi:hypothetical protein